MRMKSAVKFQLSELRWSVTIYYFVIVCVILCGFGVAVIMESVDGSLSTMTSSIELSSGIFLFVVGLNAFKENFGMYLQNGISRRTMFLGTMVTLAIICIFMGIVGEVLGQVGSALKTMSDKYEFLTLYDINYGDRKGFQAILESILMCSAMYYAFCLVGLFITTLYYRMGKALKLIVSIGVPTATLFLFPILDFGLFDGRISRELGKVFICLLQEIVKSPYALIMLCLSISAVSGLLCWLLMRRAVVK